uniref:Uncharacterized protein n=1 Tax=Rhipicephalus zambeziensis TaxID=60191 RepID=A0A224YL38_9ACAR
MSMGAATHGASASMGMMGSTQICPVFVLLTPCDLNPLCRNKRFSNGLAGTLHHLDLFRLTNSNRLTQYTMGHSFIRNRTKTKQ